jgi:hypothetical protein
LNVPIRIAAEPDIRPSRRHGERREASLRGGVGHGGAVDAEVGEPAAASPAPEARLVGVYVAEHFFFDE